MDPPIAPIIPLMTITIIPAIAKNRLNTPSENSGNSHNWKHNHNDRANYNGNEAGQSPLTVPLLAKYPATIPPMKLAIHQPLDGSSSGSV